MLVLTWGCRRMAGNRYNFMLQVSYKTVPLHLVSSFPLKCTVYSIKSLVLWSETANDCLCIVSRKGLLSGTNFGELLANCITIKIKGMHGDTYRRVIGAKDVSHIPDSVLVLLPQGLSVGVVPLLYSSSLSSGQSGQQGLAILLFSS